MGGSYYYSESGSISRVELGPNQANPGAVWFPFVFRMTDWAFSVMVVVRLVFVCAFVGLSVYLLGLLSSVVFVVCCWVFATRSSLRFLSQGVVGFVRARSGFVSPRIFGLAVHVTPAGALPATAQQQQKQHTVHF